MLLSPPASVISPTQPWISYEISLISIWTRSSRTPNSDARLLPAFCATANLFPPYSRLDAIIRLLSWDSSCTNKSSEHLVSFITVIIRASTKAAAHSDYVTLAHSFLNHLCWSRFGGMVESLLHQEWCNAIMWNMLQQKGQVKAHQNETGKNKKKGKRKEH